jgi:hypothetical protein
MQADHEIQKEPEAVTEIPLRSEAYNHLRLFSRYICMLPPPRGVDLALPPGIPSARRGNRR